MVNAAEYHGVAPALYSLIRSSTDVPIATLDGLEQLYRGQWQLQLRALADLSELSVVLDGLGVEWAVFKGPILAEAIYARGIPRSYVDLDVLLPRRALADVVEALEAGGARVTDRAWTLRFDVPGELGLTLRHGTALDLHWHLLNESRLRRAFSLHTGELLGRTRRLMVNGRPTPTLDAADTLVHIATHAALTGGGRLLWFKDLEQVLARDSPQWDEVVQRTAASGLSLIVATMLERTTRLLGAHVPSRVLDSLGSRRGWRAAVRVVDRLHPPERHSFGTQMTGGILVAATRRSTTTSAAALARSLAVEVARPLLIKPDHPWRAHLRHPSAAVAVSPPSRSTSSKIDRDEILRRVRLVAEAPSDP